MEASEGFPPIASADARVLVLGSLPGLRSIAEQQYYGHPRNAFWPIMERLFAITGSYEERCAQLVLQGIALWDVLASSVRTGSMDANIRLDTAAPNDIGAFLCEHREIRLVAFNGKKAEALFENYVGAEVVGRRIRCAGLPSTSPAYASMPFSRKLAAWRKALAGLTTNDLSGGDDDRIYHAGDQ